MTALDSQNLAARDVPALAPLIRACRCKPYRYLRAGIPVTAIDSFAESRLASTVAAGDAALQAVFAGDRPVAAVITYPLPWDSEVLEKRVAGLELLLTDNVLGESADPIGELLEQAVGRLARLDVDLVTSKAFAEDAAAISSLQTGGFHLMDTLLDYVWNPQRRPLSDPEPKPAAGFELRLASASDAAGLGELGAVAFSDHCGRYHADPRISRSRASEVYRRWLHDSAVGYGDWVVVAEIDGALAGCSVWKRPSAQEQEHGLSLGHYSIGAVHPAHRGRGLFTLLTRAGMKLLADRCSRVEGPTHVKNHAVQRGYERLGWSLRDARHGFHKWLT